MFDIVSAGHFSIDSIFLPGRKSPVVVLGGSVAYVSIAASRLEARVGVLSKVGGDFPEAYRWWLRQEGINMSGLTKVDDAITTRFALKYDGTLSSRVLFLKSTGPCLTVDDVPASLKASVVHVSPIAGEITYDVIEKLKTHASVLSLDPQGLVREYREKGKVRHCSLTDKRILGLVDIHKSSLDEILAITELPDLDSAMKDLHDRGVRIVIVTLGSEGAVISTGESHYDVPAIKPTKLVDPTGAGDAFIGGFLAEYVNDESILRCACVGAASASFVVEGIGPTSFADKTQVYQRARELYEKEIKQ
jgi:sugar/nucleoside kinase (ribokinase family)